MKNLAPLFLGLMIGNSALAFPSSEPTYHPEVSAIVDETGSSVDVSVSNHTDDALICAPLSISISFIREEFDLPAGNYSPMGKSFFLYPNQTKNLGNVVKEEINKVRTLNRSIRVYNAVTQSAVCKKATFNDYCSYAQKNNNEQRTMGALSFAFNISDCESWIPSSIFKVNLSGMKIDDLYPLTFFENLSVLRIGNNPVSSISQIKDMKNLRKVCLKDTAVPEQEMTESIFRKDCI